MEVAMKKGLNKIIGILLVIAAVSGLIICIAGIIGAWQVRGIVSTNLGQTFDLLDNTLGATGNALEVADQSLQTAQQSVDTLATTIQITGKSISDTVPLIDSLTQLTTQDLPDTVSATQTALEGAKTSAQMIDTTLTLLTAIPFLPLEPYTPEVSLSQALGDVSTSLDPLTESFTSMESSLTMTRDNMVSIGSQIDTIANNVSQINTSLGTAGDVIGQYKDVVDLLQKQVAAAKASLPRVMNMMAWLFTVVLVWLGLTQVGLLMQGFEMLGMEIEG
jgi:peptidoglycan hydrolase CwlO-like protein